MSRDGYKPRVLIVHNHYQIPGGEDTVVDNEKRMLERNGHRVVLYTRSNQELRGLSKLQKLMLPFTTIFNQRTYKDVKRIIREERIDIVHVHNTLSLISPSVYYAAVACHVPVMQTIHNFRLLCPGATFYRDGHICEDCLEKGFFCAVRHRCYRGSCLQTLACVINTWIHRMTGIYKKLNYICLTEFNRERLLTFEQISPERVFVKPNFVEDMGDGIVPLEKRENRFIFVGRLERLKGVDVLLRAWKEMGDIAPKLLLCGSGPMEGWCREYITRNGLSSVEMTESIPNIEARRLIADSRALILPTRWYEGFPMSIVEAFSVGTPVIVSDLGNAGSLVEEGVNGYKFTVDLSEDLIRVVYRIDIHPDIYAATRAVYEERYTEGQNYGYLMGIYQEVS